MLGHTSETRDGWPVTSIVVSISLMLIYISFLYISTHVFQHLQPWPPNVRLGLRSVSSASISSSASDDNMIPFDPNHYGEEEPEIKAKLIGCIISTTIILLISGFLVGFFGIDTQPNELGTFQLMGISRIRSLRNDLLQPIAATLLLLSSLIGSHILNDWYAVVSKRPELASCVYSSKIMWIIVGAAELLRHYRDQLALLVGSFPSLLAIHALLVGPIAEELVFRSAIISVLEIFGGFPPAFALFFSSFLFSLAHAHLFLTAWLSRLWNQLGTGFLISTCPSTLNISEEPLVPVLIQCGFTFVYGVYAAFFFLKRRNVFTSIIIHIICNLVGFPKPTIFQMPLLALASIGGWLILSILLFLSTYSTKLYTVVF